MNQDVVSQQERFGRIITFADSDAYKAEKARCWVVGRTHSWLNAAQRAPGRRLLIRWEKKGHNYLALLHFACALITWNQCLFG